MSPGDRPGAAPTRVALFGGTFDPPHVAHVLAVAGVLSVCDVDAVWVLPVARHPLGKSPTSFTDRLALCHAAFGLFGDAVAVRDDEARSSGRTFDLVTRLRREHPATYFRLVIGSDQLAVRDRWHRFDDIAALAPPVLIARPGFDDYGELMPAFSLPDVSSTAARAALAAGQVPTWLPRQVGAVIAARRLYGLEEAP